MSRTTYPAFSEDELIIEEDEEILVDESYYNPASARSTPPRPRGRPPKRKSPGRSPHRAKSKYDHRPRNVVIGANDFSPSPRRGDVSIVEYEERSQSRVHWSDGEVEGQILEVRNSESVESVGRGVQRGAGESLFGDFCDWLSGSSQWKVVVVGVLLALVCGSVFRGLRSTGEEPVDPDNLLNCPSHKFDQPCLTPSQIRQALVYLEPLKASLHAKAGQYECGERSVTSRGITISELRNELPKDSDNIGGDLVDNILTLILNNPKWNIVWYQEDDTVVTNWLRRPLPTDRLESLSPAYPLHCRFGSFFSGLWQKMKLIVLILVVLALLVTLAKWKEQKNKLRERNKFLMVDKILGALRQHHETVQRRGDLIPYLAIVHVRDMLISPSERDRKLQAWEEACEWIAKYESRVRIERQRIAGQDFDVWKWIQDQPPATEEPDRPGSGGTSVSSPEPQSSRKGYWYSGTTFDDDAGRSTGRNSRINSPYGSLSPCIRLKNMFETVKHMKDEQSREIEDSVLDRCTAHGGVVHIYVDRRSTYGCVYLKMDSMETAMKAYKALHGGWYKGKLVTAKYIPLDKYHKWFPAATSAKKYIYPSS